MKRRQVPHWARMKARMILEGFDNPDRQVWNARALIELAQDPKAEGTQDLPIPKCLRQENSEFPAVEHDSDDDWAPFDPTDETAY